MPTALPRGPPLSFGQFPSLPEIGILDRFGIANSVEYLRKIADEHGIPGFL